MCNCASTIGLLAGVAAVILGMSPGQCQTETKWTLKPQAVQVVYQDGVPHTDRNGNNMDTYDAQKSFFPLALYHSSYTNRGNGINGLSDIAKAGFNTVHLCWGESPRQAKKLAREAGVQLISHHPGNEDVLAMKDSSLILAWYLNEEPTQFFGTPRIQEEYDTFKKRYSEIKAIDPKHPIFLLDGWWMQPADVTPWWVKLNTVGDITCHDNYPITYDPAFDRKSISSEWGIPESVSLAVSSNKEKKPMWLCVQSHCFPGTRHGLELPTTAQERCMVYTGIIHGATGIIYFGMDSIILRQGNCIGIAPNPKAVYAGQTDKELAATSQQLRDSRNLWNQVVEINREIAVLRPAILSRTASLPYEVYTDPDWASISKDPIRTLLKKDPSGGYMLLLVNVDSTAQRVRVKLPGLKFQLKELFQAPGLTTKTADEFTFTSPPYDTRVFHIDIK